MTRLVRVMVAKSRMRIFRKRMQQTLDYQQRVRRVAPGGKHPHPAGDIVYDTEDAGEYVINGERMKRARSAMGEGMPVGINISK